VRASQLFFQQSWLPQPPQLPGEPRCIPELLSNGAVWEENFPPGLALRSVTYLYCINKTSEFPPRRRTVEQFDKDETGGWNKGK